MWSHDSWPARLWTEARMVMAATSQLARKEMTTQRPGLQVPPRDLKAP
jgi:hypothetical protein